MDYELEVREVAASPTAVVAQATTWDAFPALWPTLLGEVYDVVRSGVTTQTGHNVMLYRDDVPNVEVGVQVDGPFEPVGRVVPSELPAGTVVATTHHGPYDGLGAAHAAVHAWCAAEGVALTRTRWEVYGDWREDPEELETEVCYLVG